MRTDFHLHCIQKVQLSYKSPKTRKMVILRIEKHKLYITNLKNKICVVSSILNFYDSY